MKLCIDSINSILMCLKTINLENFVIVLVLKSGKVSGKYGIRTRTSIALRAQIIQDRWFNIEF